MSDKKKSLVKRVLKKMAELFVLMNKREQLLTKIVAINEKRLSNLEAAVFDTAKVPK